MCRGAFESHTRDLQSNCSEYCLCSPFNRGYSFTENESFVVDPPYLANYQQLEHETSCKYVMLCVLYNSCASRCPGKCIFTIEMEYLRQRYHSWPLDSHYLMDMNATTKQQNCFVDRCLFYKLQFSDLLLLSLFESSVTYSQKKCH
jgi:NAD-dependent dihydropyrimidine dehydrogenase PreA subunit